MQFRKKPIVIEAVKWNGCTIGLTNGLQGADERLEKPAWLPPVSCQIKPGDIPEGHIPSVPLGSVFRQYDFLWIGTLEGSMRADPGDWIIRGIKGEVYPCKPDIFAATYDAV